MRREPAQTHKLIALLLAVVVVSLGALSVLRKVETFQPVGLEAGPVGGVWAVTSVDAPGSGIEPGDQVLLVEAREVDDLRRALRQQGTSTVVVQRGGEVFEVTHTLPPLAVDWTYLFLALIGIGYLVIGLYTVMRERRSPATLFYLWCLSATTVYLFSAVPPFDAVGRSIYLIEELARVLLAPLTLHLFWVFPKPLLARGRSGWAAAAPAFFYLPAAFLLSLQANLIFGGASWFGNAAGTTLALLDRLVVAQIALFSLAAVVLLAWRVLTTRAAEHRRQVQWMVVGLSTGYVPFLLFYVLPNLVDLSRGLPGGLSLSSQSPTLLTSLGVLPLALVPLTFAYAILRYKLWDLGGRRPGLAVASTELTAFWSACIGFSLINLVRSPGGCRRIFNLARNLLTFTSGLAIAGLMIPARRRIGEHARAPAVPREASASVARLRRARPKTCCTSAISIA